MKNINVIYDYDYDEKHDVTIVKGDVDIISVPDVVFENLENIVQEFFDWAYSEESDCWTTVNNEKICCAGANEFVKWLNKNYSYCKQCSAKIIEENVKYNPKLPCAEF